MSKALDEPGMVVTVDELTDDRFGLEVGNHEPKGTVNPLRSRVGQ